MLIELPFIASDPEDNTDRGKISVDPDEVAMVCRGWDRIQVGLKAGPSVHSYAPKLKTAVIEGTPDRELLDKWYAETVKLINEARMSRVSALLS